MTELLHQIILEIYLNTIEFGVEGIQDLIEMPNMPKMEVIIEGVFQYEPNGHVYEADHEDAFGGVGA